MIKIDFKYFSLVIIIILFYNCAGDGYKKMSIEDPEPLLSIQDSLLIVKGSNTSKISTLEQYKALFDGLKDESAIGDASPAYIYNKKAAELIDIRSSSSEIAKDNKFCDFIKDESVRMPQILDPSFVFKEIILLS